MVQARLGRDEQALHWLQEAARLRDYNYVCVAADPSFDTLRGHAGYAALLRATGLANLAP